MTAKKFLPLLIIAIIIPTVLSSCGGVGEPLVDISIDVDRCYLNAYDVSGTLLSSVIVKDAEADDLYSYFAKSGYVSRLGDVADEKPYISATFEKSTENGEFDGVVDFVVYSTDKVELNDEIIGRLDGTFEMLASTIAAKVRDVEFASIGDVREYNSDGREDDYAKLIGSMSRKIFYALDEGEYVKGDESRSRGKECITVSFQPRTEFDTESGDMYEFKVYEDNFVTRRNIFAKEGYASLGYLEGVYEMLEDTFDYYDKIREAESKSGFSYTTLIIETKLGAEYDLTDFPEVKCLRAGVLIEGDNSVWWTLIIESDSEKEILEAKNHLESREDILSVSLDYIMRID